MNIVYEYGLLQPTGGVPEIHAQLSASHRYYNKLIELERARWEKFRALTALTGDLEGVLDEVKAIKERIEELRALIQEHRKKKTPKTEYPELIAEVTALKVALTPKQEELAAIRKKRREAPEIVSAIEALNKSFNDQMKAARAETETYWGSYLLTEDAFKSAKEAALNPYTVDPKTGQKSRKTHMSPPSFRRWTGDGNLGVLFVGGVDAPDLFSGKHTLCQISPVPQEAYDRSVPRGQRTKLQRTVLRFRVDSDSSRAPVWAEWPMIMHRPFPEGAKVKSARVHRTLHLGWSRWVVQFTLHLPEATTSKGKGSMAIDLGWRKRPDGVRVGYWMTEDGREGEHVIPASIQERLDKADDIHSKRSKLLDILLRGGTEDLSAPGRTPLAFPEGGILAMLKGWSVPEEQQEEFKKRMVGLHLTKSTAKVAAFWHRFKAVLPVPVLDLLTPWFHRDKHLGQYETGIRQGAIRHRREVMRVLAAQICAQASKVVLEDFHLPGVTQHPEPEDKPDKKDWEARASNTAAHQRVQAGPSIFRSVLMSTARRMGVEVVKIDPRGTSRTCSICGYDKPWKDKKERMHTCEGCGATWDRDSNAARNILKRGESVSATWKETTRKVPRKKAKPASATVVQETPEVLATSEPRPGVREDASSQIVGGT